MPAIDVNQLKRKAQAENEKVRLLDFSDKACDWTSFGNLVLEVFVRRLRGSGSRSLILLEKIIWSSSTGYVSVILVPFFGCVWIIGFYSELWMHKC